MKFVELMKFLRLVLLVGALCLLVMVGWLAILRADEATESNMIAFVSNRDIARWELHVMLADGSNARRILVADDDYGSAREPSWSPDGEWIAFSLGQPDGSTQIYRIRPDGSDLHQLTRGPGEYYAHDWSPDSQWIAYHDAENVFVMRADGNEHVQLTQDGSNKNPSWSPDGEWIIFLRKRPVEQANTNLHQIRPDGSGLRMLTPPAYSDWDPAWSSDGEWIIFGSDVGTNFRDGYFRMRVADSELFGLGEQFNQRVLTSPVNWSSSGEWAVYQARPAGNGDIFRTRADGSEAIRLTHHQADDWSPTWSPPISLAWRGWVNALAGFALLFLWTVAAVWKSLHR